MLISLLGLLVYSNTFYVPFQWDDDIVIRDNPIVKDLRYFTHPSEAKKFENLYFSFRDRYMGYLSFALNYKIHGLDVKGYHAVNIALHMLNALLVYALVRLTLRTPFFNAHKGNPPLEKGDGGGFYANYLPLFVSLIFVSHPVQTEAVTYIMGRLPLLMWFFYLSSMVLYAKWRLTPAPLPSPGGRGSKLFFPLPKGEGLRVRGILYLLSFLSAVLAMKTKENAFTLPFSIALYEFMFFTPPKSSVMPEVSSRASMSTLTDSLDSRQQHAGMTAKLSKKGVRRFLYLAPFMLTLLIIPLSLVSFGQSAGEVMGNIESASRHYTETPRMSYLFTQFVVLATYLRLLFLPVNQNFDYDYPVYDSIFNPQVLISFIFLLSIFGTGVYLLIRSRSGNPLTRLLSWGVFWFFLTLSVESSIFPIPMLISEYRLYAPSIGIILAVVSPLLFFTKAKKGLIPFLAAIVIVLSYATYARNDIWRSNISLWEDVVGKSPNRARGHYNLGNYYKAEGFIEKAIEQYKIALVLKPDAEAYNNLGNIYLSRGMTKAAVEQYRAALTLEPYGESIHLTHYNLGGAYLKLGLLDNAIGHFQTALKIKPDYAEAQSGLGVAYFQMGHKDKAVEHFRLALKLKPDFADARDNIKSITGQ